MKKLFCLSLFAVLFLSACVMQEPPKSLAEQQLDSQVNELVAKVAQAHRGRRIHLKEIINPNYYLYLLVDENESPVIARSKNIIDLQDAVTEQWPVYEFDFETDLLATQQELQKVFNKHPEKFNQVKVIIK